MSITTVKFNCQPAQGEIITVPQRKYLIPFFDTLKQDITNTVMPTEPMINYLGEYIGSRFNVDVLHVDNPYVETGSIEVSAEYDGLADEEGQTSIKIILVTNLLDDAYLWNAEQVSRFVFETADSICHELAHMRQARLRNFIDVSWDYIAYNDPQAETRYYLSHPDEIDAYSHNIASELEQVVNKLDILHNPSLCTIQDSINLWTYLTTFKYDYSNRVLKKLLKKIYILCEIHSKSIDFRTDSI